MTSQGHDQDDLIRRMRVADEPPLKKGAMNRMSSEEEFPHAAVSHDPRGEELIQDSDNGNTKHRRHKTRPALHVDTDLIVSATATKSYPSAHSDDDDPHQLTPITSSQLPGPVSHHSVRYNPRRVTNPLPRRVSHSSSSDADDEEEIPVSFEPRAASTLPFHLQLNLLEIESESLQKVEERTQRSARVAAGNSFSQNTSANITMGQEQSTLGRKAKRGTTQGNNNNDHHDQLRESRQSIDAFDSYPEPGRTQLSYANITNPDARPPSSSEEDKKKQGKGKKVISGPLQGESNMAEETNLAGGFVAPHQEATREPSMYPDMFENARIWRARTSPDPYAEHGIIGTMEKMRLEADAKPKDPFGVSMMGGMGMMEQMEAMKAQAPGSQAANPYADNGSTEAIRETAAKPVDPFQGMGMMERMEAKKARAPGSQAANPYADNGSTVAIRQTAAKPADPFQGMGMMERMEAKKAQAPGSQAANPYADNGSTVAIRQTAAKPADPFQGMGMMERMEAMNARAPGSQAANPYADNRSTETIRETAAKRVDPFQGMVMERTQAKIAQRGSSFPNKASPLGSHAPTDAERAFSRKLWEECEKEAAEKEIAQYQQTLSGLGLTSDSETQNDSSEVVPVGYWKAESREMGMRSSPAGFPGQVNDSDETTESDQSEGRHHTVKGKAKKDHFDFFTSKNSSRQNITREESSSDSDGSNSPWAKGIVGGKKKSGLSQRSESRLRTRDENRTAPTAGPMYKKKPSGYTLNPTGDTAMNRTQRLQDPTDNDNTATIGSHLGAKYYHLPNKNGLPRTRRTRALHFDTENTDTTGSVMTAPTQRYHDPTDDALTPTLGSAMTRIQRSHDPSEKETTEGHSTEDCSTEDDPAEVDPATIGLAMTARGRIENY